MKWISERQRIYNAKQRGAKKPWTKDPILQQYRFCNVYREQDAVTKWISDNWRTPNAQHPDLWFAMVIARLFNKPETLGALGFPYTFRPAPFVKKLKSLPPPIFNGAYIVSTNGIAMNKVDYLVDRVLKPLWAARAYIRPTHDDTLGSFHARLTEYDGIGSFIGAQVVADLKYVMPLKFAPDWWSWASSGPGSRRGLNRVCGRPYTQSWSEKEWAAALHELQTAMEPLMRAADLPLLHAQDLQNCLCEFDKYERTRLGDGKPKQKYGGV